jgi:peptidoglycan/xylan/chitin deacetylase (PgdA/CDA1 family)
MVIAAHSYRFAGANGPMSFDDGDGDSAIDRLRAILAKRLARTSSFFSSKR